MPLEFSFITNAVQKTNAQNVAVKIAVEIENVAFNRRLFVIFKCRANTDIRDASAPHAFDQICGRVNAVFRNDAIMRFQIRGRKTDRLPALDRRE